MTGDNAYLTTMTGQLYVKPAFTELEDCRAQGQAAGDQAYGRDENPYPVGTARREWWDAGWCESLDDLTGR